jgi:hypothetical protein
MSLLDFGRRCLLSLLAGLVLATACDASETAATTDRQALAAVDSVLQIGAPDSVVRRFLDREYLWTEEPFPRFVGEVDVDSTTLHRLALGGLTARYVAISKEGSPRSDFAVGRVRLEVYMAGGKVLYVHREIAVVKS